MKKPVTSNTRIPRLATRVLLPLVLAALMYFGVVKSLPSIMQRMAVVAPVPLLQVVGIGLSLMLGLYALTGIIQWIHHVSNRLSAGFRVDPREDLRILPPLKGELSDAKKVELLALTKIATDWDNLEDELKARGYRMVPHSQDLCLATLDSTIEVLCTMSSLGHGSSYESLCKRFGPSPEHLVPLRRLAK